MAAMKQSTTKAIIHFSEAKDRSKLPDIILTRTNPTLDYPFLQEESTISHIRNTKVMFVMRGLPGSGKSTLAEILAYLYPNAVICSADKYFFKRGSYQRNSSELENAHLACQQKTEEGCRKGRTVIVDNTNIRFWEMQVYWILAKRYSYITIVVEPKTSWRREVDQLVAKTKHNVNLEIMQRKMEGYLQLLPLYFGWFLNERDSKELLHIARIQLQMCLRCREFKKWVLKLTSSGPCCDLLKYYDAGNASDVFHCTACYSNRRTDTTMVNYAVRDAVRKSYGRMFVLNIIGFVITPRTFGARVILPKSCMPLWSNESSVAVSQSNSSSSQMASKSLDEYFRTLNISCDKQRCGNIPTSCIWMKSNIPKENFFKPIKNRDQNAHITLGCGDNWPPSQAGLDQANIISLENSKVQSRAVQKYDIDQLTELVSYSGDQWVIYLKQNLTMKALFAARY